MRAKVKATYSTTEVAAMIAKSEDQLRRAIRSGKILKPAYLHAGAYAWVTAEITAARDALGSNKRLPWEKK